MDIFEIIKSRRSVFPSQYNKEEIQQDELDKILEAANWAPNHRQTEPWRFKIVKGHGRLHLSDFLVSKLEETNSSLSDFKRKKITSKFESSNVVIAICYQRDPKSRVPEWEEVSAVAMAVQNMWLTCTSLKIGSYWSSPSFRTLVDDFFNLEEGESCLGFFYMGKYDGILEEGFRKSSIQEKVTYI